MTTSTVDDPIRADVERVLQRAVEAALYLPLAATSRVQRCARTQVRRAMAPLRLVRSLLDVAGSAAVVAPVGTVSTPAPIVVPADLPSPARVAAAAVPAGPDVEDLPIEEYESLAASHVVARLGTLTPTELRRVRAFESAHRGRRTVLGKVEQLLGEA